MKHQLLIIINLGIRVGRGARPHPSSSFPRSCPSLLHGPHGHQGTLLRMSSGLPRSLWSRPSVLPSAKRIRPRLLSLSTSVVQPPSTLLASSSMTHLHTTSPSSVNYFTESVRNLVIQYGLSTTPIHTDPLLTSEALPKLCPSPDHP